MVKRSKSKVSKNRKSKSKRFNQIVISICIFLIMVSGGLVLYDYFHKPVAISYLDVHFEVGDRFGIKAEQELDFGRVVPGSRVDKKVSVVNGFEFPITMVVRVSKNFKGFVYSDFTSLSLDSGESFELPVYLYVPEGFEYGNYSGVIRVESYKI